MDSANAATTATTPSPPATAPARPAVAGLEGVVVAETALGDVRGEEGFYHYRGYRAQELARDRGLEEVWHLFFHGRLPSAREHAAFAGAVAGARTMPARTGALLATIADAGEPLEVLRSAVSLLGAELGWRPTLDAGHDELAEEATRLCALVPVLVATSWRLRRGLEPVPARGELSTAANYLWMLTGADPEPAVARGLEQYLVLMVDHGLNASTFAARVIASTGADLAAAVCGAIGALSGPLHGGAPSRVLSMLDEIGSPERAEAWIRAALQRGERLMGFGHRAYKTDDPRSVFLREVALGLGGPRAALAAAVEESALAVLAEVKPGRRLRTNVELYAAVVMEACGLAPELFTPTFALARTIGWSAHVLEQAAHNRLIRPASRYVGPAPPVPLPAR